MGASIGKSPWRDGLLLLVLWVAGMGLLGVLQRFHTGMGLLVWPLGEDRVWLWIMQSSSGRALAQLFWSINDRNPLSPYWYLAAKPLIFRYPNCGWYLLRRLLDLLCAGSVFLLINRLGRNRHRLFAWGCAVLTLLWQFSTYRTQCTWDRTGSLVLVVLSLWAYCKFIDSDRKQTYYLPVSLLLYLVTLGTYTLQASSFLAVFFLALSRTPSGVPGWKEWGRRFGLAVLDIGLYAALFCIFVLIWSTTKRPVMNVYYQMSPELIGAQLWSSLSKAWWHPRYTELLQDVSHHWSTRVLALAGAIAVAFFALFLRWAAWGHPEEGEGGQETPPAGTPLPALIGWVLVIVAALLTGPVCLESTSTTWYPGCRTQFFQQVFHPLLYSSLFFAATVLGAWFWPRPAAGIQLAGVSVACALALVVGLEFNRQLNEQTAQDQQFLSHLKEALPAVTQPTNIIMKLDGVDLPHWGLCTHRYIQTYYNCPTVNMQFLRKGPAIDKWSGYNTMVFGPDEDGVCMMDGNEGLSNIPYREILFARYDGRKVTLLETVTEEDLRGYRVKFARTRPIQGMHPLQATLAKTVR